jgi:hypothetical protein
MGMAVMSRWHRGMTAFVPLMLLAACGRDKPPPVAGPDPAASKRSADEAVMKAADVGAGWSAVPGDQLRPEAIWTDLLGCLRLGDAGAGRVPEARSPTLAQGAGFMVASAVWYVTDDRVQKISAGLSGNKAEQCARTALAADLEKGRAPGSSTVGEVQATPLRLPSISQNTWARRGIATFDLGGKKTAEVLDFVVVVNGNAVSTLAFKSAGGPFPQQLQITLVNKLINRA